MAEGREQGEGAFRPSGIVKGIPRGKLEGRFEKTLTAHPEVGVPTVPMVIPSLISAAASRGDIKRPKRTLLLILGFVGFGMDLLACCDNLTPTPSQ